jgi:hypothetical protein
LRGVRGVGASLNQGSSCGPVDASFSLTRSPSCTH